MKATYRVKRFSAADRPQLKALVVWKDENGTRSKKFFGTIKEAETFAQQRETELLNQGREALSFSTSLRVMAQRCDALLKPFGKSIEEATLHFIETLKARAASCELGKVLIEFLAQKKAQDVCRQYQGSMKNKLGEFCALHRGRLACEITVSDCNAWLASLDVGSCARNNTRLMLVSFFSYAETAGYVSGNPAHKAAKFKVVDKGVGIVSPEELARLLEAACPETLVYIAIAAFAGVRAAELLRLDWSDIDLDEGFIEIRAAKSKTATRRLIKIQPCLGAWLETLAKPKGRLFSAPGTMWKKLIETRARAGMGEWPKNALRHSFASYHLAHFKDANGLALEMGHAGCQMIFAHYRQVVRQSEALRYWNVLPAAPGKVLEMALANQVAFHHSQTQPRKRLPGVGGHFVSANPARLAYEKSQREYAAIYHVTQTTIRKWQDMGRPLDDAEEMARQRKPLYAHRYAHYCAIYGKALNTIKKWAAAGWPLDDEAGIKAYLAARKFGQKGKVNIPAGKALRLLTLPEATRHQPGEAKVYAR